MRSSDDSGYMMTLPPAGFHRQPVERSASRLDTVKLLYKPVGIVHLHDLLRAGVA